jgi:hypothetical protein
VVCVKSDLVLWLWTSAKCNTAGSHDIIFVAAKQFHITSIRDQWLMYDGPSVPSHDTFWAAGMCQKFLGYLWLQITNYWAKYHTAYNHDTIFWCCQI